MRDFVFLSVFCCVLSSCKVCLSAHFNAFFKGLGKIKNPKISFESFEAIYFAFKKLAILKATGILLYTSMVPRRGLEPPHLAAHGPEPCASTNSATWAYLYFRSTAL